MHFCPRDLRWEEEDGYLSIKTYTTTVSQCFESLNCQLPQCLWHCFMKQKQSDKECVHRNDSTVLIQMDFSENATCEQHSEIQSVHWTQRHCIQTVMWYYRGLTFSMIILSDSVEDEKRTVSTFTHAVLEEVLLHCPEVKDLKICTYWPSSQFKNKFILVLLLAMNDTLYPDLRITWNYFATSHGKGPNDALGATSKCIVHRKIMAKQANVNNAHSYAEALQSASKIIMVKVINHEDISNRCELVCD